MIEKKTRKTENKKRRAEAASGKVILELESDRLDICRSLRLQLHEADRAPQASPIKNGLAVDQQNGGSGHSNRQKAVFTSALEYLIQAEKKLASAWEHIDLDRLFRI